jgi:RHS repeat-associated protein
VEAFEYQRYQTGAQPFWTSMRFPGQYYDAETDLFENWNRYYDPGVGRYLQPEPVLAVGPNSLPAYAYAANNPMRFTDRTGNAPGADPLEVIQFAFEVVYGGIGLAGGGNLQFRASQEDWGIGWSVWVDNHPLQPRGITTTFGHLVCSDTVPSSNTYSHETQHTHQADVLGGLYLPAHLVSQAVSAILTGTYNGGNLLEMGPYSSPARPWPWEGVLP